MPRQDEEGNIFEEYELHAANKKWNDSFSTEIRSFKGYEVKNITIDGKEQTVIYTYKLKKAAPIHVNYMDIETKKYSSSRKYIRSKRCVWQYISK
ncbi:TPA: MucBP domain-containing protein [Enterococcus faecalis]|uniref:MucBP domain-containing protein n=1 Tax=Enterococcus faecalis TaxID=1351 RepID=UPI0011128DB5|nr:hypothetical protein [Enterococcus faecalis]